MHHRNRGENNGNEKTPTKMNKNPDAIKQTPDHERLIQRAACPDDVPQARLEGTRRARAAGAEGSVRARARLRMRAVAA